MSPGSVGRIAREAHHRWCACPPAAGRPPASAICHPLSPRARRCRDRGPGGGPKMPDHPVLSADASLSKRSRRNPPPSTRRERGMTSLPESQCRLSARLGWRLPCCRTAGHDESRTATQAAERAGTRSVNSRTTNISALVTRFVTKGSDIVSAMPYPTAIAMSAHSNTAGI